jgi:gliding motility-associated-like protein
LRYLFVIFIFCLSRSFAQVGAPSLRCLQVSQSGSVTLIWVPPTNTGNSFNSYDIYYSNSGTTFTLLANIPGSITTSSYLHATNSASQQSLYYYMQSRSGSSGASVSGSSDTLKTIFLNLIPGSGSQEYLKITYNNLRQPKLPTTNSSFSILKEYPIGSWGTLTTTTGLGYNDTLSVCQASINYQIRILDNSGCFSSSNYQGGIYNDTKTPNEPVIDSISVLPTGNVVLAWRVPRDADVIKYRIYKLTTIGPSTVLTNAVIDTVNGRNNTSYVYFTNTAYGTSISIFLSSLDSCARISPFTNTGGTMHLKALWDQCNYTTILQWNPYLNMPKGLLDYRVYYSKDGVNFTMLGATSGTTFTHNKVDPDKNICYYVRAFNTDRSITASSNWHCFFSSQVKAPKFVYIRSASVLSDNSIQLKLFLDTSKFSRGIDLFRSEDGNNYLQVGYLAARNGAFYSFNDNSGINPDTMSYYYKGSIKDSCGNTRTVSNVSKTIVLRVSDDKENIFVKNLRWNSYSGFAAGVNGYNIYRVINGSSSPQKVGNTGLFANTYTDNLETEAPNGAKIDYMVEALESTGNPYGFMESSTSNQAPTYMEGRIFVPTAFAPAGNGKNKSWLPVTYFIDKKEYSVRVFNRWGEKVFDTPYDDIGWDGGGAPPGVYAYVISYKNARGEYMELKGTFLLL